MNYREKSHFDILLSVRYVGSFFITYELRMLIIEKNLKLLSSNDRDAALTMTIPEARKIPKKLNIHTLRRYTHLLLIYTPTPPPQMFSFNIAQLASCLRNIASLIFHFILFSRLVVFNNPLSLKSPRFYIKNTHTRYVLDEKRPLMVD